MDRWTLRVFDCSDTLPLVKQRLSDCGIDYTLVENRWDKICGVRVAIAVIETKNRKDSLHIRKVLGCNRTGYGDSWEIRTINQIPKLSRLEAKQNASNKTGQNGDPVFSSTRRRILEAAQDYSLTKNWD